MSTRPFLLFVLALASVSCANFDSAQVVTDREDVVGKWGVPGDWWTFNEDGTGRREEYVTPHVPLRTEFVWTGRYVEVGNVEWKLQLAQNNILLLRRTDDGKQIRLRRRETFGID